MTSGLSPNKRLLSSRNSVLHSILSQSPYVWLCDSLLRSSHFKEANVVLNVLVTDSEDSVIKPEQIQTLKKMWLCTSLLQLVHDSQFKIEGIEYTPVSVLAQTFTENWDRFVSQSIVETYRGILLKMYQQVILCPLLDLATALSQEHPTIVPHSFEEVVKRFEYAKTQFNGLLDRILPKDSSDLNENCNIDRTTNVSPDQILKNNTQLTTAEFQQIKADMVIIQGSLENDYNDQELLNFLMDLDASYNRSMFFKQIEDFVGDLRTSWSEPQVDVLIRGLQQFIQKEEGSTFIKSQLEKQINKERERREEIERERDIERQLWKNEKREIQEGKLKERKRNKNKEN